MEPLKEALPKIRRVALLGTKLDWEDLFGKSSQAAARAVHIALLVPNTPSNFARRRLIVDFATKNRLPGMYYVRDFTETGGLMSYGPDFRDQFRRVAVYVDKIRRGAKPGEQPTKFEPVINLKTAKALA